MTRPITVAVGQLGPAGDTKQATVGRIEGLIDRAADEGVNVILFPELALTPFFPVGLDRDFDHWFETLPSPLLDGVIGRARDAAMVVVLPYAERNNGNYYNSALVIDADGSVIGNYRKVHIPAYFPTERPGGTGSYEKLYFRPSDEGFPVYQSRYVRLGVQICYDRMFPEGSRILALQGAELVCFPHNYSTYGMEYRDRAWGRLIQSRTYENGFFGLVSNKAGTEGVRHSLGRSMVVSPLGGDILAEAGRDGDELLAVEIDLDDCLEARTRLPWWRDRRPEMYGPLLAHSTPAASFPSTQLGGGAGVEDGTAYAGSA